MKVIRINGKSPEKKKIGEALDVLRNGGTVVYPTDTVYGLGANIYQEKAVYDVYRMKQRSQNKPISICLSKTEDIKMVAQIDQQAEEFIHNILPGPYTIILNRRDDIPFWITLGTDKIGIRIPDNVICRELSMESPITTTSANISGHPSPKSAQEAQEELDDYPDMIIDSGPCPGVSSTVLDLTVTTPRILREGAGMEKLLRLQGD
jgi:L-threonylcarbamoyladenylate synthase